MPKFWLPSEEELRSIHTLMNEDVWFERYQDLILALVNTDFGRDLLCIPKHYPRIVYMTKCSAHAYLGEWDGRHHIVADFRVGAKWANIIRYRWAQFNSFARYFAAKNPQDANMSALTRYARTVVASTLTVYPDPNPETTTFDGSMRTDNGSFAASRAASSANSTVSDTNTSLEISDHHHGGGNAMSRSMTLFDTSSLTASASISSSNLAVKCLNKQLDDDDANSFITAAACTPASNTGIVADDYDQYTINSPTKFITDIDWTGFNAGSYAINAMNANGLAAISKTGVTKIGYREGHDVNNENPDGGADRYNGGNIYAADQTGTSSDPYLEITYSIASSLVALERSHVRGVGRGILRP